MQEKWMISGKKADFKAIGSAFGIDQVVARLIRNRDVIGMRNIDQYLNGTLADLPDPWLLKDIDLAVDLLEKKIRDGAPIRIIGDYDIDGVTSTYILVSAFKRLGANCDTYIPDRVADGYGLHMHLIEKAKEDGIDTIVTCDNGIAASGEIRAAKEYGMTVVITDHHEVPFDMEEDGEKTYHLPNADAIINPKQEDCSYPNSGICGAVVAWNLVRALFERFKQPADAWLDYLEAAAIATVGDVMDLKDENRIIVKEGLKKIQNTRNIGLKALIEANHLTEGPITAYHIGFVLGPCINASGRIDTAERALSLLMAEDAEEAAKIAGELTELNASRKAMTEEGRKEAIQMIETTELKNDRVLVVFLPDTHESIAGIIAGRIREAYNKPAFVLTRSENGVKGSGRSIETYSMYEELVRCADLLTQFGGHPLAAGLSLPEENVDAFRKKLNDNCTLTEDDLTPKIVADMIMPFQYITKPLIRQLSLLEPFGKGNTKPVFAVQTVKVFNGRLMGKNRNVARVQLYDKTGHVAEGIYFGDAHAFLDYVNNRPNNQISILYYPNINVWQGRETIQIVITNYR